MGGHSPPEGTTAAAAPAVSSPGPVPTGAGSPGASRSWPAPVLVALVSLSASGLHAALGPGFVLDDWFNLRNAAFGGAWSSAGTAQQTARPGAAVVYALVFGGLGRHPLAVLAVLTV